MQHRLVEDAFGPLEVVGQVPVRQFDGWLGRLGGLAVRDGGRGARWRWENRGVRLQGADGSGQDGG
ncbi:hypothetical protein AXXA_21068 [Achromobacter insuavis AXX-A]|uniref:Uncharacterized protein n=1 Tax=Achromobacter insuavis AXX-A TaxID=1003200 RepID=F7T5I8_9BURK|nr:hypothetical protein AXXA_21068 [Achromobacter insuavis AXX-A]